MLKLVPKEQDRCTLAPEPLPTGSWCWSASSAPSMVPSL